MALKKDDPKSDANNPKAAKAEKETPPVKAAAAETAPGMFESEDTGGDTAVEEGETSDAAAAAAAATTATAQAAATSALAVQSASPLALALKKATGLDESQGVISISDLEVMGVGTFPRVTVDQGGFSRNKNEFLGSWIKIELLSWNFVTLITTGEKDDKEADKLIRSSYDHVNVPGEGMTVDQYIAHLKAQDYEKTTSKKYIEIYANLVGAEKLKDIAEPGIHQLSVSPQSVKQWQRFLLEARMKAFRRKDVDTTFYIGFERRVDGSNTYGVMQFGKAPD